MHHALGRQCVEPELQLLARDLQPRRVVWRQVTSADDSWRTVEREGDFRGDNLIERLQMGANGTKMCWCAHALSSLALALDVLGSQSCAVGTAGMGTPC
eukprot:6209315-Pleurochrysis_carterae.AAC.3